VKLLRPTCHFGAKAHIGVDSKETVVHSVATSAASVADKHMLPELLHGEEKNGLCARIWEKARFAGILKFCESGYTRFHEEERLDEGTGLAWIQDLY
jgi:IS5 family transposase